MRIYLGGAGFDGRTFSTVQGRSELDRLGRTLAAAGDVNGDGFDDVVIGAPQQNPESGAVYLYLGSADGVDDVVDAELTRSEAMSFGSALAGPGDLDGDGYADVVVADGPRNEVYVYRGGPDGLEPEPAVAITRDAPFGGSVSGLGDVDDDGYADFVVGVPGPSPLGNAGALLVYRGG
ncbi:MAG TPA: FG-GAP-like repeat-containing protein [Sandaracinaceae bacterium LLY-WYZ-13_1]|nr:FG-GAP-like repeat-containing protein [Sandaracinaceae bacterium LLY-WYZ-13_1]